MPPLALAAAFPVATVKDPEFPADEAPVSICNLPLS